MCSLLVWCVRLYKENFHINSYSEVGIYKRKQESKKTTKQELDQESDQESKKTRTRPRKRPRKKEKTFFFS